ncbi:MAG TPA: GNAT family N-acetyltransferase [Roseiflexaceae bacterium]|nr:GNAT family N-acetyltransferase [Roseiflexaceae bacterium]
MNQIRLRPSSAEDDDFLFELYCETRADEVRAFGWSADEQAAFLSSQYGMRRQQYRALGEQVRSSLILDGDRPIGMLVLIDMPTEIVLSDIALVPGYRNRGIGGALIRNELAEAAHKGKPMSLHVTTSNPAARLYARLGFGVVEDDGLYIHMRATPPLQS